jgi:hypothetical protein
MGTRPIIYLAVRYDYIDPSGKLSNGTSVVDRRTASKPIVPGQLLFFAAVPGWRALEFPNPDPRAVTAVERSAQKYSSGSITVSVDAVVFDNGELAGPDIGNSYQRLTLEAVARHDFLVDLEWMSAASDAAILDKLKSVINDQSPSMRAKGITGRVQKETALSLMAALNYSRDRFNSRLRSTSVLVHRSPQPPDER